MKIEFANHIEYDVSYNIHAKITHKIWNIMNDFVYGDVIDTVDFGLDFKEFHTIQEGVSINLTVYDT